MSVVPPALRFPPYPHGVGPLLLGAAGVLALGVAVAILRSFGPRYRVGRLLAVVKQVSIAEAARIAESGETRYVRIDGRIDSDAEFEDDAHRPLVLRRTTIQWRPRQGAGGHGGADDSWRPAGAPAMELAPFVVREGMDEIDVDAAALEAGLITVPRVSVGTVSDLGDRAPEGVAIDSDARLVVEQVSSVEHATILGVPRRADDGRVVIGAGLGRPLILATLERDEAMRILTGGAAGRSRMPSPASRPARSSSAPPWFGGSSTRSSVVASVRARGLAGPDAPHRYRPRGGNTPGFVGNPLVAILGVAGVGLASLLPRRMIRLTGSRARP